MFQHQKVLRKLAKTDKWQLMYARSSEMSGIHLFQNVTDFSHIQFDFINNLAFYYSLNLDVVMGEVTDIIFKYEIYEDAYMLYKNKERKEKSINKKETTYKNMEDNNLKEQISSTTDWVLKKARI